ncbi:hypothetical protein M5X00_13525 [Paenibacillus alvei]|uniref:hypothetical protein n=1 Tax=Paenibacillus alvei TaxID=44250 RepID=UPI0002888CF7|nr:hypothetical protein [Paenibacillus alvei]EJW13847.1 hypothetical protein PAV_109p00770 [Paenibacillus alvei DSM 29]MCY9545098.1 hypothetical protein [Paenibacillus alvei]MCY9708340.1 hypothetical protein [Paenibacillus alvei]MCY9732972.1 hypothetical protein [Paenibacillus alvei]MCY9755262.1 hypothetical protein [Paenibacillus alvei]
MFEYAFLTLKNYKLTSVADIINNQPESKFPNEWEFDRNVIDGWKGASFRFVLNELGRERWELVCQHGLNSFIFKRLILE